MLLVSQVRSDVSGERSLCIWRFCHFLTIRECIEDKRYVLSFAILHTCHSWSGHVLETQIVVEWSCVVVRNFRAPFQLLPITEESASLLNGVNVWFLIVTIFWIFLSLSQNLFSSCAHDLWFFFICLLLFSRYSPLIMSFFLSNSVIGMGGSDSEGSIQQHLVDQKVISIGSSSLEGNHHGASNSGSSSSERLRVLCHAGGGTSGLHRKA